MLSHLRNKKAAVFSWALYDFGDTLYSMNVVSFYFPLWITVDKGLPDIAYSVVYSTAVVLAALLSPWLGALSDRWQSRKEILALTSFACIAGTGSLTFVNGAYTALGVFLFVHLSYVLSLVLYNALLPNLSDESNLGRVSGLGVGLGYFGTIIGLLVARGFHSGPLGRQGIFLPTAALFLLFALPLFFFVHENKRKEIPVQPRFSWRNTLRWSSHSPKMRWFLLANFLCGDAVHTVILFMSVYSKKVFGLSDNEITGFFILSTLFAIGSAFVWGELNHRWGALKVFLSVLILWSVTLMLGALAHHPWEVWGVGALVGMALAGTWVASRVLVVELSPPERVGEYFGLYNFTGKSAAVLGPLVWGGILLLFSQMAEVKYRIAIFSQAVFMMGALAALIKVVKMESHASR